MLLVRFAESEVTVPAPVFSESDDEKVEEKGSKKAIRRRKQREKRREMNPPTLVTE